MAELSTRETACEAVLLLKVVVLGGDREVLVTRVAVKVVVLLGVSGGSVSKSSGYVSSSDGGRMSSTISQLKS